MSTPPPSDRRFDADELIAVVVALVAIGSILTWGLRRMNPAFTWNLLDSSLAGATQPDSSPRLPFAPSPEPDTRPMPDPLRSSPTLRSADPEPTPDVSSRELRRRSSAEAASPTVVIPPDQLESEAIAPPTPPIPPGTPAAPPSPVLTPDAAPTFPDVSTNYWAYPFIAGLAGQGLLEGLQDGTFQPDASTTRAQFASMLQDAFTLGSRREAIAFSDLPDGYSASPAIEAAVKGNYMRGYPDSTFKPDQPISRLEMFLSLFSGLQLPTPANPEQVVSVYPDADAIPEFAIPAIAAATQAQLVALPPGQTTLAPTQPATRAEVAATLYQARVLQNIAEPITSEAIVSP